MEDANARGITDKGQVRVSSSVGSIELEAEVTDRIMPGAVSIPHGWGHDQTGICLSVSSKYPGVSVNNITDHERVDTLCGNAVFSCVPVKVERARA
jgi:anaerobic selenocysteine-containing dehydrogenase